MAAALAFWGLLSLIPLGALAVSVFGRALGSSAVAERQMADLLQALLPMGASGIEQAIRHFPQPRGSWFVEVVSALGLLWAASRLFHTLEDVLTRVWSGHGAGRTLFARNLVALAATVGSGILFLVITVATAGAVALRRGVLAALPAPAWQALLFDKLVPVVAAWAMFALTYQYLPQGRVQWRKAAAGALAAAVMWEITRVVFAMLVSRSATYGRLYGSLAGAVVVVVWIYLCATILLVGAEIAVVLQCRAADRAGEPSCSANGL